MTGDRMVWAVVACGAIVLAAEPLTIALLRRLAVLDVPGARSSHSVPTPRGGGAPIAVGLLVAGVRSRRGGGSPRPGVRRSRSASSACSACSTTCAGCRRCPGSRLQAAGAAAVAALLVLPLPLAAATLAVAAAAAAAWLVGFVNAFNFMDGVNGISGAHALIGGVAYACLAGWRRDGFGVAAGLALAAAPPPSCPGTRSGRGSSSATWAATRSARPWRCWPSGWCCSGCRPRRSPGRSRCTWRMSAWTLQRRVRGGERWLQAHRTHVYQRWCDAGWSHQEVTVLTSALTVLLCLLGVAGMRGGAAVRVTADLAGLGVLAAYLGSPGLFARSASRRCLRSPTASWSRR